MKNSEIRTIEDLDKAQKSLDRKIAAKKKDLEDSFNSAKEFYTPGHMLNNLLGDFLPIMDWKFLALGVIRSIRKKL